MAAQGAPGVGVVQSPVCAPEGGGALRRLQIPCQTALGILPRLNVPQARWRIVGCRWRFGTLSSPVRQQQRGGDEEDDDDEEDKSKPRRHQRCCNISWHPKSYISRCTHVYI